MLKKLGPLFLLPAFVLVTKFVHADDKTQVAQVMHCHDGDTCTVKVGDAIWFNVRLFGIDSPEVKNQRYKTSQPLGDEARDFLNATVKDKSVTLQQADLDAYNRPVVEIFLDGKLINVTMVEKGFAEAYRGKTKRIDKTKYFSAEESAKKSKTGIWGLSDYVSPKTFRDAKKK